MDCNFSDILGIDPGSQKTGWGIIRDRSGVLELVDCGLIRSQSGDNGEFSQRLAKIYCELSLILQKYTPGEAAIEQIFTAQNARSAIKLGQARGVAVAACASLNIAIFDYEPTLVKKALVGAGRAEKEQVAFMVKNLLNMPPSTYPLDVTDALAVAICHSNYRRYNNLTRKTMARSDLA